MMNVSEKLRLEFYLQRLAPNLPDDLEAVPTLDEMLADYPHDLDLREKIIELSNTGAVGRFYAAVLLSAVEKTRAEEILANLRGNETPLAIQKSIGHGVLQIPLYLFAQDFLEQKSFHGEHFKRIETLANWKAAVVSEKNRYRDVDSYENFLPHYEDVLQAQKDAEKMSVLRSKIENLAQGSVAERFYAAVLLKNINENDARKILESLADEPAEVGILHGDIMLNVPSSHVAAEMLGRKTREENPPEKQNPVSRFFKWFGG